METYNTKTFTPDECKLIIDRAKQTVSNPCEYERYLDIYCDVVKWDLPNDKYHWIYQRLVAPFKEAANFYDLELVNPRYFCHISVHLYNKGESIETHVDIPNSRVENGKIYKKVLSASTLLTDPSEFAGGQLYMTDAQVPVIQHQGNTNIYRNHTPHGVTLITEGMRASLVLWLYDEFDDYNGETEEELETFNLYLETPSVGIDEI